MARAAPCLFLCAVSIALGAGCKSQPVTVREVDAASTARSAYASALSGPTLSEHSRQVLGTLGLLDAFDRDPLSVPALVCKDAFLVPGWLRALASAEVLFLQARVAESAQEAAPGAAAAAASALYVESALMAYKAILGEHRAEGSPWDLRRQLTLEIYNRALSRYLTLRQRADGHPSTWTSVRGRDRELRLETRVIDGDWDARFFDTFVAADSLEVDGLRHRHRAFGFGAPLVAVRENAPPARATEPGFPPEGRIYPATAVLLPAKRHSSAGGGIGGGDDSDDGADGADNDDSDAEPEPSALTLIFRNPYSCDRIACEDVTLPLSADLSTPYAYLLARARLHELEGLGLFDVEAAEHHRGMFLLEPYDPSKIPLVLVHGLWSSALTWRELTNEIWGDPALRTRFQVWHYMYATGAPVLDTALGLRGALLSAFARVDPEGDDFASRDVVLVGHSMGGLLSKSLAQSSGDAVWTARFKKPLAEIEVAPEIHRYLREMFFFEPIAAIRRIIFIAVPHAGSATADSLIGKLGSSMIKLPARLVATARLVAASNLDATHDPVYRIPTSIDMLSPGNAILAALRALPIAVPYHSIIGDVTGTGLLAGTDGVVACASANLEGASSVIVVPSGHDAHTHPLAIAEVRRILRAHLEATDGRVSSGAR